MTTQSNPCAPRKRFQSRDAATTASRSIAIRQQLLRLPEPCSKCNGWHLSDPVQSGGYRPQTVDSRPTFR